VLIEKNGYLAKAEKEAIHLTLLKEKQDKELDILLKF
jgi:hypothetical protein